MQYICIEITDERLFQCRIDSVGRILDLGSVDLEFDLNHHVGLVYDHRVSACSAFLTFAKVKLRIYIAPLVDDGSSNRRRFERSRNQSKVELSITLFRLL